MLVIAIEPEIASFIVTPQGIGTLDNGILILTEGKELQINCTSGGVEPGRVNWLIFDESSRSKFL